MATKKETWVWQQPKSERKWCVQKHEGPMRILSVLCILKAMARSKRLWVISFRNKQSNITKELINFETH